MNPFSNDDLFDRYAAFLDIGTSSTQEDIFNGLQKFYPPGSRFVVLSADLDVEQTVKRLIKQKRRKGLRRQKICSFFAHPVQYLYLLNKYPKLKISLGHFGGNQDWDDYIQNPPSPEERRKYDNIVSEIRSLLDNDSPTEEEQAQLKEKIETAFGLNWLYLILQILKEYENVYTDISFTINDKKYFPLLKNLLQDTQLREKILFGSDYYMAQVAAFEKHFSEDIGKYLEEDDYRQIAETNPNAFLTQSR